MQPARELTAGPDRGLEQGQRFFLLAAVSQHQLKSVATVQRVRVVGSEQPLLFGSDLAQQRLGLRVLSQPEQRSVGPGTRSQHQAVLRAKGLLRKRHRTMGGLPGGQIVPRTVQGSGQSRRDTHHIGQCRGSRSTLQQGDGMGAEQP